MYYADYAVNRWYVPPEKCARVKVCRITKLGGKRFFPTLHDFSQALATKLQQRFIGSGGQYEVQSSQVQRSALSH